MLQPTLPPVPPPFSSSSPSFYVGSKQGLTHATECSTAEPHTLPRCFSLPHACLAVASCLSQVRSSWNPPPQPLLFGGQFHGVFNICYGLEELLPGIEVLSRPQYKIPVKANEGEYSKETHLTRVLPCKRAAAVRGRICLSFRPGSQMERSSRVRTPPRTVWFALRALQTVGSSVCIGTGYAASANSWLSRCS